MSTAREVRSARGPDPARRLARRAGAGALTAVLATGAALPLVATPASATLTGSRVDDGQNITVFANIDMVVLNGFAGTVTVDVIRNGSRIGTASGPTVDGVLEVNHGPEGTAQPGDCWIGAAPDIKAGDRIVVTSQGDADGDEVTVDDIRYTSGALEAGDDVVVHGVALRADGTTPIPASALDSAEFRSDSGKYRTTPEVEARPGVPGGFTLRYSPPYLSEGRNRDGLNQEQLRQALLNQDGHSIGFGHTDPLPLEAMLVDGLTNNPGHAAGCGGTPPEPPATPEDPPFTDPEPTPVPKPGPVPQPEPEPQPKPDPVQPAPTTRTVTVSAAADAMARQSTPNKNYGWAKLLQADTKATYSAKSRDTSYLKFKIPALGKGEKITEARLSLPVKDGTKDGPKVYRTAPWHESSLTWNKQPSRISSTANGDFASMAANKRSAIKLSLTGIVPSQYTSFQLLAVSNDGLSFTSRETSAKPQLILVIKKG